MDYLTPVDPRGQSFAELVEEWALDQYAGSLRELGLEKPDHAQREGDYLLGELCFSLGEDCQWHRSFRRALARTAVDDTPRNRAVIGGWIEQWYPLAARATAAFAPLLAPGAARVPRLDDLLTSVIG
jgi:hypothetical protein